MHRPSDPFSGDSSNITEAQVLDQITNLNRYFAGYNNSDSRNVNTGIQFCLAQIGPNTNGIYRISSSLSNHNPTYENMKQLMDLKDPSLSYSDYLHVYVVNEIIDGSGSASGIKGYATFPGVDPQGIVIRYRSFGNSNTCTGCSLDVSSLGKILVHEVGHFLGLKHTFEGGCAGVTSTTCSDSGDRCCDTPPISGENTGCSPSPVSSCISGVFAMIENFMDYTNDGCRTIFTHDQAEIMHFTLQTARSWLVDPMHINNVPLSCESFSARFSGTNTVMCEITDSVRFTALKYSNMSPKYYWTIKSGGSTIKYDSTDHYKYGWWPPSGYGKYTVILSVVVDQNIISDTIMDYVQVVDCGGPIQSSQGTWYFGQYAGLKFMRNTVIPEYSAYLKAPNNINAGEGCISLCDTLGRLLYYGGAKGFGNGGDNLSDNLMELFDKSHTKVTLDKFSSPLELYSHGSCTQGSVTFNNPADTNQFYLVTNQSAFEYNINNGLSVYLVAKDISNNITVSSSSDTINVMSAEGLIAIPSCRNSWWLLFNTTDRRIAVYEFDSFGKHFRNVTKQYPLNEQGYLKSSPDGRFVGKDGIILKFDNKTGQLSDWLDFSDTFYLGSEPYLLQIYGSSFSPNSEVYYYVQDNILANGELWQLDLSKSDPIANKQRIAEYPETFIKALQLGPNDKLYMSMEGENQLGVINYPDSVCSPSNTNACGYSEDGPYTQIGGIGGISQYGLPNMIDTRLPGNIQKEIKITQLECDSVILSSSICCAKYYDWDFGDLSPKVHAKEVSHRFSGEGTYIVSLTIDSTYTITRPVYVGIQHNGIVGRTLVCDTINAVTYSADKNIVHSYQYSWSSNNATVTTIENTPNFTNVRWHGNGKLYLSINDVKTGCQSSDSIQVQVRKKIMNNVISAYPYQKPCKISIDSIAGSTPTQISSRFTYGWIFQGFGQNPQMLQNQNKKYLLPDSGSSGYFKRIVYDDSVGCYSESNTVKIVNIKNEIGGNIGKCGGRLNGSNMSYYDDGVTYKWWTSNDSFATDSILESGTYYYHDFLNSSEQRWTKRLSIHGSCTASSNIVSLNRKIEYQQDLDEVKYICGNGANSYNIEFKFISGLKFSWSKDYTKYYKISKSTGDTIEIWNSVNASVFKDGDTVFAKQYISTCGIFYSGKCIIRKSFNPIHFTIHPSSETKAAGASKTFFAAVDSIKGVRWNWQVSSDNSIWYDIIGTQDNDTFIITNLNRCQNGRYYRVQAITGCGVTNSNSALLTITGVGSYTQDYWMKDHWRDTGVERNPDSLYVVESADLWVRNKADGIKPLNMKENQMIAEGDNYIYYTVRNRGVDTAKNGKLYLYWTWAGTGEEWPRKWKYGPKNMFTSPNTGTSHPMGSEINSIAINLPDIKKGDSIRDYVKWDYNVPKPSWFIKDNNLTDSIWPTANICLLARVQTCEEPEFGMTYKEKNNLHYNVIGNNNIVTRNCWMRFLSPPKSMDYVKKMNDGNEGKDMGTTVVGSIHDIPTKYKLCVNVVNSSFLTKANLYLEMSTELKNAWITGGSYSSGIEYLQDNIFKVTGSSICLDSIYFEPEKEGTIRVYASYKDPNSRFDSDAIYPISITQYQYNNLVKVGEVRIEITDNPMPKPVITTSTTLFACQWDMGVTPTLKYIHTDPPPYAIWDNTNSGWLTYQPSGIYYFEPASYLIRSVDSISNTIYENLLTVESGSTYQINSIDTVWYNCDYPDSVDYVKSCENGVMYDQFDQVITESSPGHYTLDPQEPFYSFVCADSTNCAKYSTQIKFMDIIQIPASTSNNLTGMYNREENPCCFIDLTEAECDGETPLTFGQEIQVYDMNADFLYQTNLELYGGTVLGFRFCPPQWDTTSNVINNWYSIVIRNDECSFCRMDFMCDSISDPEPFVILNYPSGKPMDNLGLFEGKSAKKGPVTKPVKPQKLPPSISIYPNPTQSEVIVKIVSVDATNITVNITDMAGKSVCKNSYKTTNNQLTTSINLSELVSGIYTIYVPELNYYHKLVLIK